MKTLLILAILSLSTYANAADELICNSSGIVKTQVSQVSKKGNQLEMVYTQTDNSSVTFDLAVTQAKANKYDGKIQYSYYGDIYEQGTFTLVLPETYGHGTLTYQFDNQKTSTSVPLTCTRPDNR
jgi:hypothetical protein